MSYILEALKKSDRERKQGKVPTLETVPEAPRPRQRREKPFWPFVLLGVLALGIVVLLAGKFYRPAPPAAPTPAPEATATTPPAPPPPLPAGEPPASTPGAVVGKKSTPTAIPAENVEVTPTPAIVQAQNDQESLNEATNIATPESALPQTAGSPSEEKSAAPVEEEIPEETVPAETFAGDRAEEELAPPPDNEEETPIVELGDLSKALRQGLPEIKIGIHLYSETPSARRASVNGRLLKEGDQVGPGLYLVEITRRGAIFSYRGRKFSIPVLPY